MVRIKRQYPTDLLGVRAETEIEVDGHTADEALARLLKIEQALFPDSNKNKK